MRLAGAMIVVAICGAVAAGCSGPSAQATAQREGVSPVGGVGDNDDRAPSSSLFDLFQNVDDPNVTLEVNKYLWVASQEVLNFMPIENADPFSGVLVMGYGVPPGGSRAYRATVYVQDPALDARALNLSCRPAAGRPARTRCGRWRTRS